jgi:hypothetical protein
MLRNTMPIVIGIRDILRQLLRIGCILDAIYHAAFPNSVWTLHEGKMGD